MQVVIIFEAQVLEFYDKGYNEYKLRFIQLPQPYEKKHKENKVMSVHLQYKCPPNKCAGKYKHPTKQNYINSIELLRKEITASKHIKFRVVGGGYKKIKGTQNEYQSKGLKIHDNVVYSYYHY